MKHLIAALITITLAGPAASACGPDSLGTSRVLTVAPKAGAHFGIKSYGGTLPLQPREVVLTFGQRNRPFGAQALISHDGGATWDQSRKMILAGDASNGDCGYPSSVELAGGRILTIYYQVGDTADAPRSARARAITWEIPRGQMLPLKKGD